MRITNYFRTAIVGLALSGAATVIVPSALAQTSAVRGGITGAVTDATGAIVPGATVTIKGPQGTVTVMSDKGGRYSALGLVPGIYTVTITAPGFDTFSSKGNEVIVDQTVNLNAPLKAGKIDTVVSVDAGATTIDIENTSVNTTISDTLYESLPLGRSVAASFYLAPGVVSGGGTGSSNPAIGGSSGLENLYIADGVTITDQAYGGLGVYTVSYGSLGTGINLAFIKEVDIKTAAFEPKYGQADGGVVEIVTKSGGDQYHGQVAAFVQPQMGFANPKKLYQYNYVVTTPSASLASPLYELQAEGGGYIPTLREKLFFFGAYDPTLNRNVVIADPAAPAASVAVGAINYNTTANSWAGKLTYAITPTLLAEASSFGDPSKRNNQTESLSTTNTGVVSDSYNFGTRDSIFRVSAAPLSWLTAQGSISYSTEHFTDVPEANSYSISDRTTTPFVTHGFGTYYKTKDANYVLQGDLIAKASFYGKHTMSIGYLFDHVDFANSTLRTGANFAISNKNYLGTTLASVPAAAVGAFSNATFYLQSAGAAGKSGCTGCAQYNGFDVYLQQERGTYVGSVVNAVDRYKTAYGNEVWSINKFVTLNAGLRWEEQAYGGSLLVYNWKDNWSPRVGITGDPFGDRKSKIFFNYARYQNPLPLDAAIRQLGNEQDDTGFFFAPNTNASNVAIPDASGFLTPNFGKVLNLTAKSGASTFTTPNFASSTGEGILPGTKMEYIDEFVLGVERELKPGMTVSARWMDRQLERTVEDIGSQSPEFANAFPQYNYAGGIANPSSSSDYFLNEKEIPYTYAQFIAANGAGSNPGTLTAGTYKAPVAGCTYANDALTNYGDFYYHYDGTKYGGACITNYATADTLGADGVSDGFATPHRHYQALQLTLTRALRNHWQARVNYTYSKLYGNYEGFFRNDNGQSDPGISSLFDFTTGVIGLLGDQFKPGYLNTDHRSAATAVLTYTFDGHSGMVGKISNGITVGSYLHAYAGAPLSQYQSHPVYQNPGEVPIGGRGTSGNLPTQTGLDLSAEDDIKIFSTYKVHLAFDGFNVTDSQMKSNQNQDLDTSYGSAANADFGKPTSFAAPFHARFEVAFVF